jgi:phosphatidylserine decarboxylase
MKALFEARWILGVLAICWLGTLLISPPLSLVFAFLLLFTFYFFRDPKRIPPSDPALAVAPADGVVVDVLEVDEDEYLHQRVKRVGIFLSVLDVHINRSPIAGEVQHSVGRTGRFLDARNPASSQLNARRTWVIKGPSTTVIVRQITGAIARRICPWKEVGDVLERGEKFGLIRFGSRTEVDFPMEAEILVKIGDRVRGGETPVAHLESIAIS